MAKKTSRKAPKSRKSSAGTTPTGDYELVIVESPAKAKTIEKYLGRGFVVKASVGHIRDLPSRAPKGIKQLVPGVDLEHDFAPTYEVDSAKKKTVTELRKLAKGARDIWFATDLDREGEAIAWHLAEELKVDPKQAKRVTFDAITKSDVQRAFENPRGINMPRVEAQQARRIVDRIVGYRVSPILWKKVASGLSAGRVQSVASRLVVEREKQIRDFTPDESWELTGYLSFDTDGAEALQTVWDDFMSQRDDRNRPPTIKQRTAWLSDHRSLSAELVEVGGKTLKIEADKTSTEELVNEAVSAAEAAGLVDIDIQREENSIGKGRAKNIVRLTGKPDSNTRYSIDSIDVKRTKSRPYPPFITSTLQQAASSRLSMSTDRTMRVAQQLYEGIDLPGEGRVGLITYMRTDSTNLSGEAIRLARRYLEEKIGAEYLPEKPRFYSSSNQSAQEAHEAIRPTDPFRDPDTIASALNEEQLKLYRLIWQSFVGCQATDAEWDSTAVRMRRSDKDTGAVFKTNGRVLRFDGCLRITGIPKGDGDQVLPDFEKGTQLAPFSIEPRQKFQAPPPRYSEATLVKKLEEEGIGRPSTYASIINVIENRGYVEQRERRFYATALGEAVTEFLEEGFHDQFIEVGYTREIEQELDQVAEGKKQWTDMLHEFYEELVPKIEFADQLKHKKAESTPSEYACPTCNRRLEYRLGKTGRFLSCCGYNEKILVEPPPPKKTAKGKKPRKRKPKEIPACTFAMPVDRDGRPLLPEQIDLLSPTGTPMVKRTGRFGDFLVEDGPPPPKKSSKKSDPDAPVSFIMNIDKKGNLKFPAPPPILTDIECSKCGELLNLRDGKRGPWLGCSKFPKCRGRGAFAKLPEKEQKDLRKQLADHMKSQQTLVLTRRDGQTQVEDGTPVSDLTIEGGVAELEKFTES
ncbi:MAG: type I DNA topoisomerase [Planctomycetes bacterium]|nr:type I DNA topoisomerase [Planctomycetota bacterium]MBL6908805.1 type I DNA topoisomerase [Pirellulales bacterium]MBL7182428.1 type I DNA topoisomerase [Pirellulales bacterium]HAO71392.1 type I DNA topoisomerase [Planctomycetaceae bacterium]